MRFLICLLPVVLGADLRFANNEFNGNVNGNGQCRMGNANIGEMASRFAVDAQQMHKRLHAALVENIPAERGSLLFAPASILMGLSMLTEATDESARDFVAINVAPAVGAGGEEPPKMVEASMAFIAAVSGGANPAEGGASFGGPKVRIGNAVHTAPGQPLKPEAEAKFRGCLNAEKSEGPLKADRIIRAFTDNKITPPASILTPTTKAALINTMAINARSASNFGPEGGDFQRLNDEEEAMIMNRENMLAGPRPNLLTPAELEMIQNGGAFAMPENEFNPAGRAAFMPRSIKNAEVRESEDGRHKIISMPVGPASAPNSDLKLHLAFPKNPIDDDVRNIDPERFQRLIESAGAPRAGPSAPITMPRFKLTQSIKLNSVLKNIGLKRIVKELPISGITEEQLIMDDATMKAILKVDGNGVQAAVVTVLKEDEPARENAKPSDEPIVNGATLTGSTLPDRPFAFILRHEPTGAPLFVGFVENSKDRCNAAGPFGM